jgi:hypothetical protein
MNIVAYAFFDLAALVCKTSVGTNSSFVMFLTNFVNIDIYFNKNFVMMELPHFTNDKVYFAENPNPNFEEHRT